jgi:hypothetical protein
MEIRFRIDRTSEGKFQVQTAVKPFDGLSTPWSHHGTYATAQEAVTASGDELAYQYREHPHPHLWQGPFTGLERAREAAYNSVDPPYTLWAVVELYGDGFDRPAADGSGEMWGQLWVVPDEQASAISEAKGAVSYQILDSYGYDDDGNVASDHV